MVHERADPSKKKSKCLALDVKKIQTGSQNLKKLPHMNYNHAPSRSVIILYIKDDHALTPKLPNKQKTKLL